MIAAEAAGSRSASAPAARLARAAKTVGTALAAGLICASAAAQTGTPEAPAEADAGVERPADRTQRSRDLGRRPDERRPAVQYTTNLFGRPLTLGGQYEITHQTRQNFDLDSNARRNRSRLDQELKLEMLHRTTDTASVFVQAVGVSEIDTHRSTGRRTRSGGLERGQTWIYVDAVGGSPVSLQAGRVGLIEPRTWWWDDDLDAIRMYVGGRNWLVETGIARELARVSTDEAFIDPAVEDVTRWFGRAALAWRRRHTLEAYWLSSRDSSAPRHAARTGCRACLSSDVHGVG